MTNKHAYRNCALNCSDRSKACPSPSISLTAFFVEPITDDPRTPLGGYSNFATPRQTQPRSAASSVAQRGSDRRRRGGTNRQHARQRKAAQRSMSASRPQPDHRHHRLLHNQPGLAFSSRFRRDVTGTRRAHARRTRFVRPSLDNNKGATGGTLCARPRPRQKRDASHRPAAMKCPDKGRPRGAE